MLGSLARWLRICGYDVKFLSDMKDERLIEIAKKTKHILLTRDKLLVQRAKKNGVTVCFVKGDRIEERLKNVSYEFNLKLHASTTRCPKCNGLLKNVDKYTVKNQIPLKTFTVFNEFWRCHDCRSVYWRGSHWGNIEHTLNQVNSKNQKDKLVAGE
jgi:uncharacterized protein with PIN domain